MAQHTLSTEAASSFATALNAAPLTKIIVKRFTASDQNLINISGSYTDEHGNEQRFGLDSDSAQLNGKGTPEADSHREAARQAILDAMRIALDIYAEKLASHPASPTAVFERTVTSLGIIARNPGAHITQNA